MNSFKDFFCLAALSIFFLSSAVLAFDSNEITQLTIGSPISDSFKSGEKHLYSLTVRENEVVEITYDKKGVDLKVAVFAPDNKIIVVSNAEDGFTGQETLLFPAEKAGRYQIEITSRRPGSTAGNYTILLKDVRSPQENDLARIPAMKLAGEAREIMLGAENRVEKVSRAIEKLEKAVLIFEKAGDLQSQANALFYIGLLTGNESGKSREATVIYDKVLDIQAKLGDDAGRAISLVNAANEQRDIGNIEKSQAYFDEALLLNKKLNDTQGEAFTLSLLCKLDNDTGKFQKGFEACRESLRLDHNADPVTNHRTYSILAALYDNTGDNDSALKHCQIALDRVLQVKDYLNPIRVASIQGNLAGIYYERKNYDEAAGLFEKALKISEEVKRPVYSASFLTQMSRTALSVNEYGKALQYAEKSLALFREYDPRKRQAALNAIGQSSMVLGQPEKARAAYSEALMMNRQNKDRYAEAETLYNLAKLEKDTGNTETALSNIEQTIHLSEISRSSLLGKSQRLTYLSILKRYYELKIEILLTLNEKTPDSNFSEQAWQTHEKNRARSLLENFLESGFNPNEVLPKDFFVREKTLLEAVAAAESNRTEAKKAKNSNAEKTAEINLQDALDNYEILQEEMRRVNPQFSAISAPKELSFADAQQLLDDETAFLEYSLGEKQSYVWLISKLSVKVIKLPARQELNRMSHELYLALTDPAAEDEKPIEEKSKQLSQQILQPVAKDLVNFRRLVVIDDGSLQSVPFSVLTLSTNPEFQPLVANTEIVVAPSISNLVYLRENKLKRQSSPDKLLAVFADPIFRSDDERLANTAKIKRKLPLDALAKSAELSQTMRDFGLDQLARLPFTGIEAREISKFEPQKTVLATGANASRQKFLQGNFNSYKILHFATHGFLNQENPDLSGLVLSLYDQNRQTQNGFLRVIDLYSLKLNADLVVLSACQTGLGKDVAGEGVVGLTRGFMYAGASGVVASLWKVDDAATAELMKRFYRSMLKDHQPPSAALRIAKNEIRQIPRYSSPQNWAGFILTGEWR